MTRYFINTFKSKNVNLQIGWLSLKGEDYDKSKAVIELQKDKSVSFLLQKLGINVNTVKVTEVNENEYRELNPK